MCNLLLHPKNLPEGTSNALYCYMSVQEVLFLKWLTVNFTHSDNGCDKGKKLNRTVSKSWKYLEIKKKRVKTTNLVSYPFLKIIFHNLQCEKIFPMLFVYCLVWLALVLLGTVNEPLENLTCLVEVRYPKKNS